MQWQVEGMLGVYTEKSLGTKLHVHPQGAHSTATSTSIGLMRNAVICLQGEGPAQSAHLMQRQAVSTMTVSVAVDARIKPSGYQEQSLGAMVIDRPCRLGLRMFTSQLVESGIAVPIIAPE